MEQYLLDNVSRYQSLVERFRPQHPVAAANIHLLNSSSIIIATRTRPILASETSSGQVRAVFPRNNEIGAMDIHELRRVVRGLPTLNSSSYRVGNVFDTDCSTEEIYRNMVEPLLPCVWKGGLCTVFAYGQTGSGKTYTISGIERLLAKSLFDNPDETQRRLFISVFEIAGNCAFDLLDSRAPFSILEDSFSNTQLVGIKEHLVESTAELLALIDKATSFRQTAGTEKNDVSSRSHSICRIRVENLTPPPPSLEDGVLYLVDLAGSEAARDIFNHSPARMKETREINKSLSVLKDCIRGIAEANMSALRKPPKEPYIPFRHSTLTKVLKHVFDPSGNRDCKTAVLACINPSFLDTAASKNTLRYAHMLCAT